MYAKLTRWTPALLALVAACAAEPVSNPHGRAAFALQTATSNAVYRLEDAEFLVRGAETVTLAANDFDPDMTVITTPLTAGNYTVTLRPGWRLTQRAEDGSFVDLQEVALTSPNPASFSVVRGTATPVTFAFRTPGEPVEMTPGGLALDVAVNEGPLEPRRVSETALSAPLTISEATGAGIWEIGSSSARLVRYDGTEAFVHTYGRPVHATSVDPTGRLGYATITGTRADYEIVDTRGTVVGSGSLALPPETRGLAFALGSGSAAALVGEHYDSRRRIIRGRTTGGASFEVNVALPDGPPIHALRHAARFDVAGRLWTCGRTLRVSPIVHVEPDGISYGSIVVPDLPETETTDDSQYALLAPDSFGGAYVAIAGRDPRTTFGTHVLLRVERWASEPTFVRMLNPDVTPRRPAGIMLDGYPQQLTTGNGTEAVLILGGPNTRSVAVFSPSGANVAELDFGWTDTRLHGVGAYGSNIWLSTSTATGEMPLLRRYAN